VLDVGCGTGAWVAEWLRLGVSDAFGLDGDYIAPGMLAIPPANFGSVDLNEGFDLGRRFDLVSTLEVAEHLPADRAEVFVESLVRHSDTVLFSAAIPGQGGYGHVNEQWPSYWASRFADHGLLPATVLRPLTWLDREIEPWYRQNTLLFMTEQQATLLDTDLDAGPLDVVHPELAQLAMGFPRVVVERLVRTRPGNATMRLLRRWSASARPSVQT
jgi:hypothetical protein